MPSYWLGSVCFAALSVVIALCLPLSIIPPTASAALCSVSSSFCRTDLLSNAVNSRNADAVKRMLSAGAAHPDLVPQVLW